MPVSGSLIFAAAETATGKKWCGTSLPQARNFEQGG
jgi:hypothetical protein